MFWNQQVEMLPKADMVAWQNHKINQVVERIYGKSLLYGKRMNECGVHPENIKGVKDLVKLPFTTKQDIADHYPYGLLTMPISGVSYIHSIQPSDGMPTAISYTNNDMIMWTELMSRMLVSGGINMTSVFQVAVGGEQYPNPFVVYNGARQVGATLVPAAGALEDQQLNVMQDFGVTGIFSTAKYMLALAKKMRSYGMNPQEMPLQTVFCDLQSVGEEFAGQVQQEYRVETLQIYGVNDVFGMGIGGECHCSAGLHIQEDCFYPEIIESLSGQVLPVGESGELVLTSLTLEAMPIIRYRTGIRGYLDDRACTCGRTLIRFNKK